MTLKVFMSDIPFPMYPSLVNLVVNSFDFYVICTFSRKNLLANLL